MGVYKEGKNWKVQVYYKDWQGNRKRKQKRGFRTKGEAKEWERDFLQQQSQGVDIEFGNFLEIYYKDMDVRLRENTMYTKRYIIDLKIKPYFEKKILSEITVADVRAWQNELLTYKDKNGKGYSPTYLKTVNCQLTAIFNYAMRYYNLQDNPCRKAGAIGKSKGEPKDFWMQEEFNAFLETVSDKPETRMAFLLLYWTGMRIGELLALTYNDINLEEKTISINKSYQRLKGKDMITQPKTPKSIRVITMPDFLAEEFREYCSHLYGIMKKERLFRFTKSHMEHCMATGIERSGVKRIRLHDLRHSHASMLVDMGVAPLEIAERLGHEKVETTLNTYSHLYPSTQSKLAGLLDKKHEEEEEEAMAGDRHGKHNTTTISFRVNSYEKATIEERVKVSGMKKQDYIVRSCIYNHVCVVGKKETIEIIRSEMKEMSLVLEDVAKDLKSEKPVISEPVLDSMTERYLAFLEAALWMLKGSSYLWEDKKDGRESNEGL